MLVTMCMEITLSIRMVSMHERCLKMLTATNMMMLIIVLTMIIRCAPQR